MKKDTDGEVPADPPSIAETAPAPLPGGLAMSSVELDQAPALAGVTIAPEPRYLARRTFAGRPDQIPAARKWLATTVLATVVNDLAVASDVLLACSELAANAIIHSNSGLPGGIFTVRACIDSERIRIEVIDQGGSWTSSCSHKDDCDDQSGRGLMIVAAIAGAWGIAGDQEGRTAWCEIRA
jgi:serine/threonine-protein kinase RsbW